MIAFVRAKPRDGAIQAGEAFRANQLKRNALPNHPESGLPYRIFQHDAANDTVDFVSLGKQRLSQIEPSWPVMPAINAHLTKGIWLSRAVNEPGDSGIKSQAEPIGPDSTYLGFATTKGPERSRIAPSFAKILTTSS